VTRGGTVEQERPGPGSTAPATDPAASKPSRRRWLVIGPAVLAVAALLVAVVASRRPDPPETMTPAEIQGTVEEAVAAGLEEARNAPPEAALVHQAIVPSLVLIRAEGGPRDETDGDSNGALGSGVIINDRGAILTARHVIAGARSIHVTFFDGTEALALVANEDPDHDIAVLVADQSPEVIVPAVLGGGVQVGDAAYAVGHPLGLVGSLTAGVISGLDRSIPLGDGANLDGLIQFDAAVNPGSSGGPLLNRNGEVVGIVTALANPSQQGYFIGVGFAVPIGTASGAAGGPEL
jgi:S1-C subfamily serine protease